MSLLLATEVTIGASGFDGAPMIGRMAEYLDAKAAASILRKPLSLTAALDICKSHLQGEEEIKPQPVT